MNHLSFLGILFIKGFPRNIEMQHNYECWKVSMIIKFSIKWAHSILESSTSKVLFEGIKSQIPFSPLNYEWDLKLAGFGIQIGFSIRASRG